MNEKNEKIQNTQYSILIILVRIYFFKVGEEVCDYDPIVYFTGSQKNYFIIQMRLKMVVLVLGYALNLATKNYFIIVAFS